MSTKTIELNQAIETGLNWRRLRLIWSGLKCGIVIALCWGLGQALMAGVSHTMDWWKITRQTAANEFIKDQITSLNLSIDTGKQGQLVLVNAKDLTLEQAKRALIYYINAYELEKAKKETIYQTVAEMALADQDVETIQ